MDFNLQTFLSEMRNEINAKLDSLQATQAAHETRLTLVEQTSKSVRRVTWLFVAGVVVAIMDFVKHIAAK